MISDVASRFRILETDSGSATYLLGDLEQVTLPLYALESSVCHGEETHVSLEESQEKSVSHCP